VPVRPARFIYIIRRDMLLRHARAREVRQCASESAPSRATIQHVSPEHHARRLLLLPRMLPHSSAHHRLLRSAMALYGVDGAAHAVIIAADGHAAPYFVARRARFSVSFEFRAIVIVIDAARFAFLSG